MQDPLISPLLLGIPRAGPNHSLLWLTNSQIHLNMLFQALKCLWIAFVNYFQIDWSQSLNT